MGLRLMKRMPIAVMLAALMAMSVGVSGAAASTESTQAASGPVAVDAGGSYVWSLTNVVCYYAGGSHGYGGITGRGYIRENGTSGTTWFRMTARFQRKVNGVWYTTQSKFTESSAQFPNNSNWHSLTWPRIKFNNTAADFTHFTRLYVLFEWFHGGHRIFWATRWSSSC